MTGSFPTDVAGEPPAGADSDAVVVTGTDDGVRIVDQIERHQYTLSLAPGTPLRPAEPEQLLFPVDVAVTLTTDRIELPDPTAVYVRDEDGRMLETTDPPTETSFPAGEYYLEVCGPVKVYLRVRGPLSATANGGGKHFDLEDHQRVLIGARSKHERPAGTVTTTARPVDVMAAVSTFGSALKTTSPERSFPTLRGHPPAVELGEELSIPDGLEPPETGVTIEVPRDHDHVFPVATLAHYLGARVVPGATPRLVTSAGVEHDLAPDGRFEREVERVLGATFLLDCVTRTEGLYDVALHERAAVAADVDLPFAALYDRPLADRLAAYLDVDHETLAPHVPDWKLRAHVETRADSVEALPFVVDDLAVIHADAREDGAGGADGTREAARERAVQSAAVDSYLRTGGEGSGSIDSPVVPTPAARDDAMERTWIGEGVPRGVSKAVPKAYRNGLDRSPVAGDVDITVVYNDVGTNAELSIVPDVYDDGPDIPFEVTLHRNLAADELRSVLAGESSFLHYVGHVDDGGFECVDGTLDAGTLESTGVESFLLNACRSYEQGMALIDAGAVGGIVTLADVVNESAVGVGSTLARLLAGGYPLRAALAIARGVSYVGDDYVVLGDGSLAVAQPTNRALFRYDVDSDGDGYALEVTSYTTTTGGMGSMIQPNVAGNDQYYVGPGLLDTFHVDEEELLEFLGTNDKPVVIDRSFHWSTALDAETIESLLGDG